MPIGVIEGMDIGAIGICSAGFMVTSWLDNEPYGQYNQITPCFTLLFRYVDGLCDAANGMSRPSPRARLTVPEGRQARPRGSFRFGLI